jgi:hypothetical protein
VGRYLEIILYDAIAGGAGYCVRLSQEIPIRSLFEEALRVLDCRRECSTACTSCLCDYSNQMAWDLFDRHVVIPWLNELVDLEASSPFEDIGCSRWEKPSLAGLTDRLGGETHLTIFGIVPATDDGCDDTTVQWLLEWLNQGKSASLVFNSKPNLAPGKIPSEFRKALRYFFPFAKDNRLQIGWLEKPDDLDFESLPRILSGKSGGGLLVYSGRPLLPIIGTLVPEPCFTKKADNAHDELIKSILQQASFFTADQLAESAPIKRWELAENEARNFEEYFSPVAGQHVEHLQIRDPYCGIVGRQRELLIEFIRALSGICSETNKITVICKEQNFKDDRHQPSYVVQKELTDRLSSEFPDFKIVVHVYPFSSWRSFHDRSLEFEVIDNQGISTSHHFDLSGGVDYLIDAKRATKIYWYKKP